MAAAGIEPSFSSDRNSLLRASGPQRPLGRRATTLLPIAIVAALLVEVLLVAMLVYIAHSDTYSQPEPIPVTVILERPAPPPPPPPPPAANPVPDQPHGLVSGPTSGDNPKATGLKPTAGASDTSQTDALPTPPAPPTPEPSHEAPSAPLEPLTKGPQPVAAAPVRSPVARAAPLPSRPKPSVSPAARGRPVDLANTEEGGGDTYLNKITAILTQHRRYPEQARALGIAGTGIFEIVLARSGEVLDVKVKKSTGAQMLDEAGIQAIRQSSPLPSIPPETPGDAIQLFCTISFGP